MTCGRRQLPEHGDRLDGSYGLALCIRLRREYAEVGKGHRNLGGVAQPLAKVAMRYDATDHPRLALPLLGNDSQYLCRSLLHRGGSYRTFDFFVGCVSACSTRR